MTVEVPDPTFKPLGECECGCGVTGTFKRPWPDGTRCVARKCRCRRCVGRMSHRRGHKEQSKAAKALGLAVGKFLPSDEENMGGRLRMECKSGKRDAGVVWTAYLRSEAQSEAARPIADVRPFVAVFMPQGTSEGLAVIRMSNLHDVAVAVLEGLASS